MRFWDEWDELNSADFGAYTSRNRLFGCFARPGLPIVYPESTHSKKQANGLGKWKACKEVLDLVDPGKSIITRKKPLAIRSLKRIYDALLKFHKRGEMQFLSHYYSSGGQNSSINDPAPTIPTKARTALVSCFHFISNPSHGGHSSSVNDPCPVIVARQDKAPLSLVRVENCAMNITISENDSEIMVQIKRFMIEHNISDIKMRMLKVSELLELQDFPKTYELQGNQADQKKFIGNSVVPRVVKEWTEAMADEILSTLNKAA
jgi:DNA (cytosine-5)-methyltransferase 1